MTGVHLVKIFKVIGSCYKRQAKLGDIVFVVVRGVDTSAHYLKDDRLKWKFRKGSVHWAIIVHVRKWYRRRNLTYIRFPRNAVILITRKRMPFTKRLRFGVPKEIADRYPVIGSIAPKIY